MWFRSPLLAAALGALALAGCGSDNPKLIPQNDADQLSALVRDAADASAAGDCVRARSAVREAELRLSGLPRKTDKRLKANLKDWLDYLDGRIADECRTKAEESPTPAPTEPAETATAEPTETATVEPTETATPAPTATATPGDGGEQPPEEPQGTGGVSPRDG